MLEGWYCRSIANMQAESSSGGGGAPQLPDNSRDDYSSDSTSEEEVEPNYRDKYLNLKKKLKYLVFENECFQDVLRTNQKKLLKVSRDRSFLLDKLLQYEKPDSSTSDSDNTESSDDNFQRVENLKRKKVIPNPSQQAPPGSNPNPTKPNTVRRRRPPAPKKTPLNAAHIQQMGVMKAPPGIASACGDGHMTPEEVERHLQSRHSYLELLPERAPPTVPTEMFSNEPSLDSESNDVLENSPNVDWYD